MIRSTFSGMLPTSRSPSGDLLVEERAPDSSSRVSAPSFVIDVAAAALLDANKAGWAAWGLDPATAARPLAIDSAMPALRRLREIVRSGRFDTSAHEMLAFWTARGTLQIPCRIAPREEGTASLVLVQAMHAGGAPAAKQSAAAHVGRASPGSCQRVCGSDIDVALDAWLAHELRTPLSAVIAYAEVLKSEHFGPLANPRYKSYARHIYDSARHALGVADSMLRGDRERTALPALDFVDLDPSVVMEGCLTVVRPLAEHAGLMLEVDLPEQLPRIVADEQSVRQMLLNLLSNALKYARRGDKVTATVAYDVGGPLVISVSDTGPGISEDARSDATGLGLGLPLTRALAAANGATLTIESAAGRGTRVAIVFGKDRVVPV
jgi:signal transduction histidine kinase